MHSEQIRQLIKAVPFRSFAIHYKAGKVFRVSNPELAWVPPIKDTTSVYVADTKGNYSHLDTSWIVEVTVSGTERRRRKAG